MKTSTRKKTAAQEKKSNVTPIPKQSHPFPVWSGILAHRENIGPAIWEFLWCLDKITTEKDGIGWVLGRAPVKVTRIAADLQENENTARDNLTRLEDHGYIVRVRTPYGFSIGVKNSRKFGIWRKRDREKIPDHSTPDHSFSTDREKTPDHSATDREKTGERSGENSRRDREKTPETKKTLQETQQETVLARAVFSRYIEPSHNTGAQTAGASPHSPENKTASKTNTAETDAQFRAWMKKTFPGWKPRKPRAHVPGDGANNPGNDRVH